MADQIRMLRIPVDGVVEVVDVESDYRALATAIGAEYVEDPSHPQGRLLQPSRDLEATMRANGYEYVEDPSHPRGRRLQPLREGAVEEGLERDRERDPQHPVPGVVAVAPDPGTPSDDALLDVLDQISEPAVVVDNLDGDRGVEHESRHESSPGNSDEIRPSSSGLNLGEPTDSPGRVSPGPGPGLSDQGPDELLEHDKPTLQVCRCGRSFLDFPGSESRCLTCFVDDLGEYLTQARRSADIAALDRAFGPLREDRVEQVDGVRGEGADS